VSSSTNQLKVTDHGFVVVRDNGDGTKKVMVCDGVSAGEPKNVYAVHFKCTSLSVHPGISMVNDAAGSYSKQVVEVFAETPGVVHLLAMRQGMLPSLDAVAHTR
jgi:hypothetical protein